ncbi:phenylpyruvate tautomerase MIF-related protein [Ruficoccus sp. ZRK36]|uniref:phenylpyruvate tautomerase MIF-related protein n=1 Tax=Ruficoccus sp. ZRK36 TaxID=2866311 RepID=UPI001C72AB7F|nr:phenylpyruvate tautomerase MIF-related protein [Ruficoccus sp. ZRK36]QYY35720.1 hypothetical protein K0V07_15645 [Ruficoccus sp. ZRK36]
MPYLNIQTNLAVSEEARHLLLKRSSKLTAELLGKPESYMMVALKPDVPMSFAGTEDPVAYLELHALGLAADKTKILSKGLCQLVEDELGIPGERIYVKFASAQGAMWGWKGDTFG